MSDQAPATNDSTDQGQVHMRGGLVDQSDLDAAGHPAPAGVQVPTVIDQITLDDDDAGDCRFATKAEIKDIYLDNPVTATPVQPDVWTLEIDDQSVTFTYSNGVQYTLQVGQLNWGSGPYATRYRKTGGLVYPTDDSGNLMFNSTTMPRLLNVYTDLHNQALEVSEQRLEMAELVNSFAKILAMNSGLDGIK
jgi:hypothetical protein